MTKQTKGPKAEEKVLFWNSKKGKNAPSVNDGSVEFDPSFNKVLHKAS